MAIQKFFEVSTIHMPYHDAYKTLDCIIAEYEHGVFLWITDEEQMVLLPKWFYDICKLALANDCHYIRFDADGHIYDELNQFNW